MRMLAKGVVAGGWALAVLLFVATFVIAISQGIWYALLVYLGVPLALVLSWAGHYGEER